MRFYHPIREVIPIAIYHWNIGIVSEEKANQPLPPPTEAAKS